jgi:hypothetical protein
VVCGPIRYRVGARADYVRCVRRLHPIPHSLGSRSLVRAKPNRLTEHGHASQTLIISVTCVLALLSACASTSSDMQVSSARYSVPKTLDDLANRASIVVRGTLLTEPTIKEIQMTAAKPGERQTESLWAFEISQIRVTDIVAWRPGTEPRPAVGDTITIGVAIVNPAVGHSIKTIEPDLLIDYPAAGTSLTGRVQQVGLFLLSGLRDLGAPDTRGFEVAAYRPSTDVTAATPLVAVAGPLRGTTPTETDLVDACRRSFNR